MRVLWSCTKLSKRSEGVAAIDASSEGLLLCQQQRPPVYADTMEADCLRVSERGGKVARKRGSLRPGLERDAKKTETERERDGGTVGEG